MARMFKLRLYNIVRAEIARLAFFLKEAARFQEDGIATVDPKLKAAAKMLAV